MFHPLNRRELLRNAALTGLGVFVTEQAATAVSGSPNETVLLGNIAYRIGGRIEWDSENMTATNTDQVESYLHSDYRKGWTL